jgi:hypothetical protein
MARETGVETLAAYWDIKIANQMPKEVLTLHIFGGKLSFYVSII